MVCEHICHISQMLRNDKVCQNKSEMLANANIC